MTTDNTIQAIQIDDKSYAVDSLSTEAVEVVKTIAENQQVSGILQAQLKHIQIGAAALQNALKELVKDVEPIETEAPAEPASVEVTE